MVVLPPGTLQLRCAWDVVLSADTLHCTRMVVLFPDYTGHVQGSTGMHVQCTCIMSQPPSSSFHLYIVLGAIAGCMGQVQRLREVKGYPVQEG